MFGDNILRRQLRLNELKGWGPNRVGLGPYKKKEKSTVSLPLYAHTEERPCADIVRRQISASQEESSHQEPNQLAL